MTSFKCPHCGEEIVSQYYRVVFWRKGGDKEADYITECEFEGYTAEEAVQCAMEFDEGFNGLIKVENVKKEKEGEKE